MKKTNIKWRLQHFSNCVSTWHSDDEFYLKIIVLDSQEFHRRLLREPADTAYPDVTQCFVTVAVVITYITGQSGAVITR